MEKLLRTIKVDGEEGYTIFCPGCKQGHGLDKRWQFNGDFEKPTFSPSLLVRSVYLPKGAKFDNVPLGKRHPDAKDTVCHSFIREGMIEFLNDSTHELAGKRVPL